MISLGYDLLKADPDLVDDLLNFYCLKRSQPQLFEIVKLKCLEQAQKMNVRNAKVFLDLGYLSLMDFMTYRKFLQRGDGIKQNIAQGIIQILENNGLLSRLSINSVDQIYQPYLPSFDRLIFLKERGALQAIIGGWRQIIEQNSSSVFKIQNKTKLDDVSIGTGYYYACGNSEVEYHLIITNKHVVEDANELTLLNSQEDLIQFEDIIIDEKRDLAYLKLDKPLRVQYLDFNPENTPLEEVITIGYPSIPLTKEAYQVFHKGEINSFVEDYFGNRLFLFSAKTSAGNSGSPILDRYGLVQGLVTQELFEKNSFLEKGKLPYYSAIPSIEIIKSINEYILI